MSYIGLLMGGSFENYLSVLFFGNILLCVLKWYLFISKLRE